MIDIESVFPHTAALELTYRCNHSCIFCSCPWEDDDTYKQSELSLQEWYAVIDRLIKYGVNYITLTGGEPLTRSDLRNIIEYIHLKKLCYGKRFTLFISFFATYGLWWTDGR